MSNNTISEKIKITKIRKFKSDDFAQIKNVSTVPVQLQETFTHFVNYFCIYVPGFDTDKKRKNKTVKNTFTLIKVGK